MKNKKIAIIIGMVLMAIMLIGVTYAFFTAIVGGGDSGSSVIVETGTMRVEFTDGPVITANGLLPGDSISKTFRVTSTGNVDALYNVRWKELYNEVLYDELELSLTCLSHKKSDDSITGTCGYTLIPVGTTSYDIIRKDISIKSDEYQLYTLVISLKETGSEQNYNQGKNMHGTIMIDSGNIYTTTVRGLLTDENSSVLPNMIVMTHSDPISAITNSRGEFALEGIEYGEHTFIVNNIDGTSVITDTISVIEATEVSINNKVINWNEEKKRIYKIQVEINTNDINKISLVKDNVTREDCFDFSSSTITAYKCYTGNEYGLPEIADVVIPDTINNQEVNIIGTYAFSYYELNYMELTSVELPNTITTINTSAFSNASLYSLTIPSGVKRIESYAFENNNIKKLVFPQTFEYVGSYAFYQNDLAEIIFLDSPTYIEKYAFHNNVILENVELGSGVYYIGDEAFSINGSEAIAADKNISKHIKNLTIPGNVKYLGYYAFGYQEIENITIEDGVSKIDNHAFSHSDQLDYNVYIDCPELIIEDSAFSSTDSPNLGNINNLYINVKNIGSLDDYTRAFYGAKIKSVTFGPDVEVIGKEAFGSYNQLSSVTIPSNVKSIGDYAFSGTSVQNDTYITSLTIENGLTYIGKTAFYNHEITELTIPSSVTYIGEYAFDSIPYMKKVNILASNITIGASAFSDNVYLSYLKINKPNSEIDSMSNYSFGVDSTKVIGNDTASYSLSFDSSILKNENSYYENLYVLLETKDETKYVSSFKLNGILQEGNSFTMPGSNSTITDIVLSDSYIIESDHPYQNNITSSNPINVSWATKYIILFDDKLLIDRTWNVSDNPVRDGIVIYKSTDSSGDSVDVNNNDRKIIVTSSQGINFYFRSNSSLTSYGYKAVIIPIK